MALLLWSGGPWRTLGAGYTTVVQTFTKWTAAGVFESAYAAVLRLERRPLKRNVRIECIDSSYVKIIYDRGDVEMLMWMRGLATPSPMGVQHFLQVP